MFNWVKTVKQINVPINIGSCKHMDIIESTRNHVKSQLSDDASGHDWWHISRVYTMSVTIASHFPEADKKVIQLAALLHDIADWKSHDGDFEIGATKSRAWLSEFADITSDQIEHICHIVKNVSYKGANAVEETLSLEGKIVQDADRLDAIGAIGIARTFAYGGSRGSIMYDPEMNPEDQMDEAKYLSLNRKSTTINHFYEKLLLLKDRMNTDYGKTLAKSRHQFMMLYLEQFYDEWEGNR